MLPFIKEFKYQILEIYSLSDLEKHKDHRRLQTFYYKGCKCVKCDREGTQLALGKDNRGNLHIDLYTDDFYPITRDHIIPKSKGGVDYIDNYQPMCYQCNMDKGNGDKPYSSIKVEKPVLESEFKIGDVVYKRKSKRSKAVRLIGTISKICLNPHTNELSCMIEGNDTSYFHLNSLLK